MAILFRVANQTAAIASSPGTIASTGIVEGDTVMLAFRSAASDVPDLPSGFTAVPNGDQPGTTGIYLFSKVAGGSEPANYTVSWTGSFSARLALVAIYSDTALSLVLDDSASQANAASTTYLCPSVTTTIANALLVNFISTLSSTITSTAGAGMTKRVPTSGTHGLHAQTGAFVGPGATGTREMTGASTSSFTVTMAWAETPAGDPPDAPSNLTATPISASRVDLTWLDNSDDEANFELEQSDNGTTGWALIASPAANATTHSVTGLPTNTTRYWRIRAVNAGGNSAYSSVASALTLNPGRAALTPRMYLLQPTVVFAARINQPAAAEYPVSSVVYDGVTTGAFADILPGMTLLLGSAAGLDDYGRQRVREVSGAGATAIVVWVGRSSRGTHDGELTIVDNAYVTVWDDRRLWAKIPYIDPEGLIFKDSNLEVTDRTTEPPPVAVMGAGFAGTIDPTTITVSFNGQPSYAVSDGATITDWLWDIADGTLVSGALTDDNITVDFPAGFRYVGLTVEDSNGHTHTTWRPVYARDPEADTSFDAFQIESHRIAEQGQTMTVRILADMPRLTYPDGTLAMVWGFEPAGAANRDHLLIIGWLDTESASMNAGRNGLLRDTTLTILDVAGRLDFLPGFPQSIADDATRDTDLIPAITWNYMTTPNLDKYLHYLLHWHSTALEVADFVWYPDDSQAGSDYEFVLLASDGDSLWNQVDRRARAFVPDRVLTCDRAGRILLTPDPMLANVADRTATVQRAIDESEWSDIRFTYQRSPRTHWLRAGAILAGSTQPLGTVFSIAPGDTPGQGVGELTQGEQLALSQAALNQATGHRYARANARVGLVTITLLQDDGSAGAIMPWAEIEPAYKEWVTITVSADTAAQRGLTWTTARALPKELNIRYNHTRQGLTRTPDLTLELETIGEPGQTVVKPVDVPAVGEEPPPALAPPDFGLVADAELLAGIDLDGYIYRTTDFQTASGSGGPTWDRVDTGITETIYSFVVDPFSPGYLTGVGAINGWIVSETDIYRVTDIFGTPGVVSVHTFAVATSAAAFHWRSIQASFGAFFETGNPWLLCVSHYADTAGHEGTWALRSVDGGVTWAAEVQISEFYDSDPATRFDAIGVWTSPRTPGLAYTVAHLPTASGDLPRFASFDNDDVFTLGAVAPSATLSVAASASGGGDQDEAYLILAAPPDAVRVRVQVDWDAEYTTTGGFGSRGMDLQTPSQTGLTRTGSTGFTAPPNGNSASSGSGVLEYTLAPSVTDWPINTTTIVSSPPATPAGLRLRMVASLASVSAGQTWTAAVNITVTLLEIELDDGTIYGPGGVATQGEVSSDWGATWLAAGSIQPGDGMAGSIHVPFADNSDEQIVFYGSLDRSVNREFRLMRADGATITDVSPSDGTRSYGVNRFGFAARAYDSDRQYIVASVTGNDTSADAGDDFHAVYVSDDDGATWAEVVAPLADTGAPVGRAAFEAAFAGDSAQVLYIWGPAEYISYSADLGATVDDRSGNLSSLGTPEGFVGIAGGPS